MSIQMIKWNATDITLGTTYVAPERQITDVSRFKKVSETKRPETRFHERRNLKSRRNEFRLEWKRFGRLAGSASSWG